ncbi:hypothetical protein [Pseudomonas sp. CGJS7]|uniref:hypothetical protein n=1 Tax=Pseudomonas sp. CGJS7 TaxID=3109348 RepID=UPI00300AFD27
MNNWVLAAAMCFLVFSSDSYASVGETRPLQTVIDDSDDIVYGLITEARLGACNGEVASRIYVMQIRQSLKGDVAKDTRLTICGPAPILLGRNYIVAGKKEASGELVFQADAAILFVPFDRYFRLISYDSPYVDSERGVVFGVGIEDPNFLDRFGKKLGLKPDQVRPPKQSDP